jgi:hypothetical protein
MISKKDLCRGKEENRTDAKVFGVSLEKRVLLGLGGFWGTERVGSGLFGGSGFGLGLVIETRAIISKQCINGNDRVKPRSSSVAHDVPPPASWPVV